MRDTPILFKYMPYRKEFFENFYLRCTPRSALNDPFEVCPSEKYLIEQRVELFGLYEFSEEFKEKSIEKQNWVKSMLNSLFNTAGIVSFAETRDNLLMWSHYANNHRGLVVTFDTSHDFFKKDDRKSRELGRVHYRKDRLKSLPLMRLEYGSVITDSTRIYFEKSDEWIYEKEHRMINDLYAVDATLCTADYYDKRLRHKYPGYEPEAVTDKLVSITGIENKCHDASEPEVLCMLQVPPECILSVICGANMPEEQKLEVRGYTQRLGISYLDAVPDADEYKLNFRQVD